MISWTASELPSGADPNLANNGGWTPLYLATDNRNIESGDYPVRKPDMDHLEFIKLLLDKGCPREHPHLRSGIVGEVECKGDTTGRPARISPCSG